MRKALVLVAASLALSQGAAKAAQTFTVEPVTLADEKAVFATVESREVVPARVRTGGTIASLSVREGDWVTAGQVVATIGDEKLTLQKDALGAQIAGLEAQLAQAQTDLGRATALASRGIVSKAQFDAATTACLTSSMSMIPTAIRARVCASLSMKTGSNSSASSKATSMIRSACCSAACRSAIRIVARNAHRSAS
jgi:multidrug efflux pump subunit AcrA (membrane-fusion protein)